MDDRRVRRINALVKKAISEILEEGHLKSGFPGLITITDVKISSDLSIGRVNFSVIGAGDSEAKEYLEYSRRQITSMLASKVNLRLLPRLQFYPDETLKRAYRIEELIKEIHKND